MPSTQELTRAWEELDAQIAAAEQEDREAEDARLWAKEKAWAAAEKARLKEEREWEHTLKRRGCELRRRLGRERRSSACARKRRNLRWSETSARRRALAGRGHRGDGFFCHCQNLPEV